MSKPETEENHDLNASDPSQNIQPSEIPEALNFALQHHNSGDLTSAGDAYRRILQADPQQPDALHLLGLTAFQEGALEKVEELITKALGVNSAFPAAHNNLGAVYKGMERLNDAAASFRDAIDSQEDFADAHFNFGNVLKDMDHSTEAVVSYQKAIDFNPDFADAHNNLGVLFNNLGRLDEAIECFHRVLDLNPGYVDAHYNLGNTLRDLDRLDEAATSYQQVLDLEPDHLKARHVLAALTDDMTEAPPDGYVSLVFDNFASQFEQQMTIGDCRISEHLRTLGERLMDERKSLPVPPFARVLDLGCGTGRAGEAFRDIAGELRGVDLSEKMLQQAQEKNVYDAIDQSDIESYLNRANDLFDLIVAADVLIYLGPLEAIFENVACRLDRGGMFAFSVERLKDGTYALQASTRYSHSEDYVLRLARDYGFNVVYNQAVEKMRNDVNGILFWLEKTD